MIRSLYPDCLCSGSCQAFLFFSLSKYFILLSHNQQKYITHFSQFPFTLSKDAKCRKEQEERELIEVRNLVKDYGGHLAVD
ncbi:MAG TPA: hypothetical protein DC053_13275, partial [Lachnoclostridium sp.]|nr:hypothetical protein [Lachnoclostridium sp.]